MSRLTANGTRHNCPQKSKSPNTVAIFCILFIRCCARFSVRRFNLCSSSIDATTSAKTACLTYDGSVDYPHDRRFLWWGCFDNASLTSGRGQGWSYFMKLVSVKFEECSNARVSCPFLYNMNKSYLITCLGLLFNYVSWFKHRSAYKSMKDPLRMAGWGPCQSFGP
jgi:hypothetical protein